MTTATERLLNAWIHYYARLDVTSTAAVDPWHLKMEVAD